MHKRPYSNTEIATFIKKRVDELRPRKLQIEIAAEAGFVNPNMMSLIKNGSTKVPLDRVIPLSKALECDPKFLFRLAFEQEVGAANSDPVSLLFNTVVSKNESIWLEVLRTASSNTDPNISEAQIEAIKDLFAAKPSKLK